jgi:hypothetical protein
MDVIHLLVLFELQHYALFRHECHVSVDIVYTRILYVYMCCLHTKIMHTTSMFK